MSISFLAQQGSAASTTFYINKDVSGSLSVEFSDNSRFGNISLTKNVTPTGRQVTLTLTSTEVETVKDSYFRVKDTDGRLIEKGFIDYQPAPAAAVTVPSTDSDKEKYVPSRLSDVALQSSYLYRTDLPNSSVLISSKRPAGLHPAMATPARVAQTGSGWTGGTEDTTVKMLGGLSYRFTTNGTGGSLYWGPPAFAAPQDWSKRTIRLLIRQAGNLTTNQVSVTCGAGNTFTANVPSSTPNGDWAVVTIPKGVFTVAQGTPSWSNVTAIGGRWQDTSAGPVNIWTHGFDLIDDRQSLYPNGVMVLEADDGYASQLSLIRSLCESLGVPLTLPLIVERITSGAAGMTVADLHSLERSGHQLACHAYSNAFHNTAGASTAAAEADFTAQQRWYDNQGLSFGALDYAQCPGTGSPVPEGDMMETLRRRFRSVRVNSGYYESTIPADPHKLRSVLFSGDSNANLQIHIDRMSQPGGVFILAMHEAIAGSTNGTASGLPAIAIANLKTVLQYAAGKGMAFRTRADLLAGR